MIVGNTHTTRVSALCFYSVKLIKSLTCIAWQNKQLSCVTISNTLTTARLGFTIVSPILAIWYIDILSVLKKFNRDLILSKRIISCLARYCKSREKMPSSPYNILSDSAGHFSAVSGEQHPSSPDVTNPADGQPSHSLFDGSRALLKRQISNIY